MKDPWPEPPVHYWKIFNWKWFEPRNYVLLGKTGLWGLLPLRMLKRQSPPTVLFGTPFSRKIEFPRSMKAFCQAQNYLFSIALLLYDDLLKQTESFVGENKLSIVYSLQATWTNCIILQVHRPFPVWLHRQAMPWTVVDQWKKNSWRKWKSWAMRCLLTLWINSSMIWEDQIRLPR